VGSTPAGPATNFIRTPLVRRSDGCDNAFEEGGLTRNSFEIFSKHTGSCSFAVLFMSLPEVDCPTPVRTNGNVPKENAAGSGVKVYMT